MPATPLLKKAVYLEYITIGWGLTAAVSAIIAGTVTGSIALLSFGLNGILMAVSPGLLLWRLFRELKEQTIGDDHALFERKVFFIVGVVFFLLALYILNESGSRLYYREKPEVSAVGLVVAALALIAASVLTIMKLRIAGALKHTRLRADLVENAFGAYCALMLFSGLGFHAWEGRWWADSVAALLMLPVMAREGWLAIEVSKGNPVYGARKPGPERNL